MRVCPKCKYVDPPQWKHSKYSYWIDNIKVEDFKELHPELLEALLSKGHARDEDYVYRITKNKSRVERKALVDYGEQWTIPMEKAHGSKHDVRDFRKVWADLDPKQSQLTVVQKDKEKTQ